uniref:Uncharacterized protein n=1 Tax=Anguilla anguilla TaxID=7936 RepID=A0A0E9VLG3_ANGAN
MNEYVHNVTFITTIVYSVNTVSEDIIPFSLSCILVTSNCYGGVAQVPTD